MSTDLSSQHKYDLTDVDNLLEDWQFKRLRGLCASRSDEIIRSLVRVYGFYALYWPDELAGELRRRAEGDAHDLADLVLIEEYQPLRYFIPARPGDHPVDWNGISRTIDLLDSVRRRLIQGLAPQADLPQLMREIRLNFG
jgi:hypothetical protein